MKYVGEIQKPTLKQMKVGDEERPVIVAQVIVPYTRAGWAFFGENSGSALNVELTPSQISMFESVDADSGEIGARR